MDSHPPSTSSFTALGQLRAAVVHTLQALSELGCMLLSPASTDAMTTDEYLYLSNDNTATPSCHRSCGNHRVGPARALTRTSAMKFRVERDALADAVAWAARSLASRPTVPVLAGLLLSVEDDSLSVSGFDLEASTQITVDGERGQPGPGAGVRPAARRHHQGAAAAPGRGRPRRRPADHRVWFGPVHAADDAGRGLPAAARHADDRRARSTSGAFATAVAQVGDRGRPRRHAADADRRPARDRREIG